MNTYFLSDLHFGHKNILAFDNRPFTDIEKHDAALIENWNSVVGIDDDVWILGDISWHNSTTTTKILQNLNGNKHLCVGNHDKKLLKYKPFRDEFVEIVDYKELSLPEGNVVLCHYPMPCFNNHFYGWYHLYGHVHNSFEANIMEHTKREMTDLYGKMCRMYNVGVMMPYMEYKPKTLEEIVGLTQTK